MFHPLIQRLVQSIPVGERVVELGNQTIHTREGEASSEEFYKSLGWKEYESIDISHKWGARQIDLNWPPGEIDGTQALLGIFDLVTNNGTGEHIFNQAAVFEWAHKLCKTNGYMVHVLPWAGYINHGFYSFHPVLFRDLSGANGYELELYAAERNGTMKRLDDSCFHHPKPFKEPITSVEKVIASFGERANVFIVAIMKKAVDSVFNYPTQGKYAPEAKAFAQVKGLEEVPSILDNAGEVESDPYPHLVIDNALPEDFYNELVDNFPDWTKFKDGNETLRHLRASKGIYDGSIDPVWRRFILRHVQPDFATTLLDKFEDHLGPMLGNMPEGDLRLGVRGTGDFDLVLDCQVAVNPPGKQEIRSPHLDSPDELIAGLLYMPVEGDEAGGDLEVYRWKDEKKIRDKAEAATEVEHVKTVPYKANQLILFVNTEDALHGVSFRQKSDYPRRYVNFILNANRPVREEPPR